MSFETWFLEGLLKERDSCSKSGWVLVAASLTSSEQVLAVVHVKPTGNRTVKERDLRGLACFCPQCLKFLFWELLSE